MAERDDGLQAKYTICTLVTDKLQYAGMVDSFIQHGFATEDCEYLYIDNTEANQLDAYTGYNRFLIEALGEYVILCHQDVELLNDDRESLELRLAELTRIDPHWGVCGNSGGNGFGRFAIRISDPYGEDQARGSFPSRVVALDENFIVVRRSANLAVSSDLGGFHHYGADLCIVADILGYSCWVIDFHLRHNSAGVKGIEYANSGRRIVRKWSRALRSRWIITSCSTYLVSRNPASAILNTAPAVKVLNRLATCRRNS